MTSARTREIVQTARDLLEAEGPEALTMRRVAERIGIRAPSLYKHLPDKAALETAVIALAFDEVAGALEAALAQASARRPADRLMTERPLRRDLLPEGVEARAAAPLLRVTGDADLARAVWAFAHGMTVLELTGRFPPGADLDAAWRRGLLGFSP